MNRRVGAIALSAVALCVSIAVVGTLSAQLYDPEPRADSTWMDFRDAGYYGARALVDGVNPYDSDLYRARYPVGQEFPTLPPTYALVHTPFLILSFVPAAVLLSVLSVLGIVVLSWWSLGTAGWNRTPAAVMLTAAAVLLSTGGRANLVVGQSTVLWVAASYAFIAARSGSSAGIIGAAGSFVKPTFGIPLAIQMTPIGRSRSFLIGGLISAGIASLLMVGISVNAGGIGELIRSVLENWNTSFENPAASLEMSMVRVDAAAMLRQLTGWVSPQWFEWLVALLVLGGSAWVLHAATRREVLTPAATIVVVSLASLTAIYHVYYDLILLLLPLLVVARGNFAQQSRASRYVLLGALLLAAFNVFHTQTVLAAFPDNVARILGPGLTGLALFVAWCVSIALVLRAPAADTTVAERTTTRTM